jgi:hemerythrin-like domain-containing protein
LEKVKQDPGGERWKAKAGVLKELVEHHLEEEEEELFPKGRDALSADELTRLAEEFDREMKRRLAKDPG